MRNFYRWLQENYPNIFRFLLFAVSIILIVQLFPRQSGFYWEFSQARPWLYEDLIAPFNFAILKTSEEIEQERLRSWKSLFHSLKLIKPFSASNISSL
jgi:cyclic-di-AMP phosphodiesterase PgpH